MYDALNTIDPTTLTDSQLPNYYKSLRRSTRPPAPWSRPKFPSRGSPSSATSSACPTPTAPPTTTLPMARVTPAPRTGCSSWMPCVTTAPVDFPIPRCLPGQSRLRCCPIASGGLHARGKQTPELDALSRASAQGKELVGRVDAFVAGVNAARQALCPTVSAPSCPTPYYQAPNFLDEIALHGPHYEARGVAFADLQFTVLIGHGRSYAWSATSANGDLVDTVMDKLCNTDGSKATIDSTASPERQYLRADDRDAAPDPRQHRESRRDAAGHAHAPRNRAVPQQPPTASRSPLASVRPTATRWIRFLASRR